MAFNPTNVYNTPIIDDLKVRGITAFAIDEEEAPGVIAIDRTSCHNAEIFKGQHEWDIVDAIPGLVKESIIGLDSNTHVMMSGKTDDVWFVDIYLRS